MAGTAETFSLYTKSISYPQHVSEGVVHIPSQLIVAMESPDTRFLEQRRYPDIGDPDLVWKFTLPTMPARLFSRFYRRTMVRGNAPRYECHSLPPYIWGQESDICLSGLFDHSRIRQEPVPPCNMEEGNPYITLNANGANVHTMLGMGPQYPRHNISVLGGDGPLAITNTIEVCDAFGGASVLPIIYGEDSIVAPSAQQKGPIKSLARSRSEK